MPYSSYGPTRKCTSKGHPIGLVLYNNQHFSSKMLATIHLLKKTKKMWRILTFLCRFLEVHLRNLCPGIWTKGLLWHSGQLYTVYRHKLSWWFPGSFILFFYLRSHCCSTGLQKAHTDSLFVTFDEKGGPLNRLCQWLIYKFTFSLIHVITRGLYPLAWSPHPRMIIELQRLLPKDNVLSFSLRPCVL